MEQNTGAQRRLRILSTEDDPLVRAMLAEILSPEGHDVEFARNSDDFFRLVGAKTYDLLILDVNVPGHNGYQIAREVGAKLGAKRPKILLFTARDTQSEKGLVALSGVDAVLEKGCHPSKVLETVNRLMNQPAKSGTAPSPAPPASPAAAGAPAADRREFERLMSRVSAAVAENASLSQRLESLNKRLAETEKIVKAVRANASASRNLVKWALAILGPLLAAILILLLRGL